MFKQFLSVFLFLLLIMCTGSSLAQDSNQGNIVHVQVWKLKAMPMGDDAPAFNEALKQQASVINRDSRVLNFYTLRHFWGSDSRDLVMITEFKNMDDMMSLYDDLGSLMEKAYSKEVLDKGNAVFTKYAGQHSDEIYMESPGTGK